MCSWCVGDRLGRKCGCDDTIREFMKRGRIIRRSSTTMTFDGSTRDPMLMAVRDALIAFMAASAQAQAEATREAQRRVSTCKSQSAEVSGPETNLHP
jgi:hypothetical protein